MATTTSITTSYAGEFGKKYISAALLSGSTIANGGIEVKPNIKFKETIKKLATDSIVKNGTCDFTATSTVTLTERVLQPEEFQVNLQLCKKDFRSDFEAISMGYSAFDNLPPLFADFLLAHVVAQVAEKTEENIWRGVNANEGEFDGLVVKATADATVIDVVGEAITAANVITEMGKTVDAIDPKIYVKEDLYLYVSNNVARAYVRALGGFAAAGLGANGTNALGTQWYNNGSLSFDGVKIFVANGLADNFMMAAQKSNLYFGTGLLNDLTNEVKVIDMADIDGSENVRIVMRFTAAVEYGIGSEIVLYTPA
tara:strand:+ start:530 stop:1465 length:936 start_codon:yes stop_codon:yes gene_type:complete